MRRVFNRVVVVTSLSRGHIGLTLPIVLTFKFEFSTYIVLVETRAKNNSM